MARSCALLCLLVAACGASPRAVPAPTAGSATPPPVAAGSATPVVQPASRPAAIFVAEGCEQVAGTPEAVTSFEKACALKSPDGCFELALRYQCGAGVARDADKALHYNEAACGYGSGPACGNAATAYLTDPSAAGKALELANKGCGLGNDVSCGYVGVMYWQGLGVPADAVRAAKIFDEQCGKKANMMACANYSVLLYMGGQGVAPDHARAQVLADRSCTAGMQAGCNVLGGILIETGGDANVDRAVALFEKVCREGAGAACDNLGQLYQRGVGHVSPDRAKAKTYYDRACQLQNAPGCTHLGELTSTP